MQIDKERCKGCGLCIEFCPKDSISLSEELNLKGYFVVAFDASAGAPADDGGAAIGAGCNGCGTCAVMCPEVAIEVQKT